MLGGAGLVTCLTFVWFSAPDLALTQLAVEVVTTVLFLLGLRWLPKRLAQDEDELQLRIRLRRIRDFSMALAAGGGLAALSYAMQTRPAPQSIAPFYLEKAVPEGGGTNVVNVMLVDFRGFDTLGEVTVLVAVALTIYALLRRFRPLRESIEMPEQQRMVPAGRPTDLIKPRLLAVTAAFWGTAAPGSKAEAAAAAGPGQGTSEADMARVDQQGYLMVPTVLVRLLLPFSGAVALYLLLRGHNEPGGGFVAGLLVAIALITQYMMVGASWVEAHLAVRPLRWMALGLLAAVGTGLASMAFGFPFLTTHTAHVTLPWIGDLHIASAMFFDLGVFAVVVGATVLILIALAHQSLRARRRPLGGDDDGRGD
jgi:multicomponent K+:H+ antiporter subunit A